MHSAKILYSTINEVTHTKMKCNYHFSENWIPAVVRARKWKLAAALQVILQKDKYLIYPFALGLKNVIFFFRPWKFCSSQFFVFQSPIVIQSVTPTDSSRAKFCINRIIIRCRFFFLFIGREPTTLPVNDCLQIIVCSCAMASNCVRLQMIFCACVSETAFFSFLRSLLLEIRRSLRK